MSIYFQEINECINGIITQVEVNNDRVLLYHYTNYTGLNGILKKDSIFPQLWFSRYDVLNDVTEGYDIVEMFEKQLSELLSAGKISHDYYELLSDISVEDTHTFFVERPIEINGNDSIGISPEIKPGKAYVCSLCSNNDSLPMWNYYCKGAESEAYNVGLEIIAASERYEDYKDHYNYRILKVIYKDTEKSKLITDLIMNMHSLYRNYKNDCDTVACYIRATIAAFINTYRFAFKKECFLHEEEYRAVLYVPDDINDEKNLKDKVQIDYRSSNGLIIPYIEYAMDGCYLKSVCLGPLTNKKNIKRQQESTMTEWLNSRGWYGVDVYSSSIPVRY